MFPPGQRASSSSLSSAAQDGLVPAEEGIRVLVPEVDEFLSAIQVNIQRLLLHRSSAAHADGKDLVDGIPDIEAGAGLKSAAGGKIRPGKRFALFRQRPHVLQSQPGLTEAVTRSSRVKLSAIRASTWGAIPA